MSLEQTMGFSSNTAQAPGGKSGAISQTDADFSATSDWSRHEASIRAKGSYYRSIAGDATELPSASVEGSLRLDLIDGWKGTATGGYSYETDTDTGTVAGKHVATGSLGISREAGIWQFALRGVAERSIYEDGLTSRKDQNNTYYGAVGRITYAANPALSPFVEVEAGIRQHDLTVDANGERRDSQVQALRGGIAFDQGEKLNGEISVGWQSERFEDKNLKDLGGLTFDGEVNWSPVRDTNVRLFASTKFDGSSTAGQNGSIVTTAGGEVNKAVNDRLELNAGISAEHSRFDDGTASETVYTASGGFRYWLNRYMALTGTVEREWLSSDDKAKEYEATSVRAGVRFKR